MSKNTKIVLIVSIVIIFLAVGGAVAWQYYNQQKIKQINDFESCAAAGNSILETYPEQCKTPDGRSFTRQLSEEEKKNLLPPEDICQNKCGDNICQEVVCLGSDCPCAENKQSCEQDCSQTSASPSVGMANPASVYCVQQGGKSEIRTGANGSQAGFCIFTNQAECEEWAYFRGECKK